MTFSGVKLGEVADEGQNGVADSDLLSMQHVFGFFAHFIQRKIPPPPIPREPMMESHSKKLPTDFTF